MYHIMLMPTDRTERTPIKSSSPTTATTYCIWDTYRTWSPLLTDPPDRQRLIRLLIDIYRHTGYMPDARSAATAAPRRLNANVVIADAWVGPQGIGYSSQLWFTMRKCLQPTRSRKAAAA
jgi:putative alpha-1,2-mannosidase